MILVSKLNGDKLLVNAHLVKYVESTPDTLITLRDGERVMVRESAAEVCSLIIDYQRTIRTPVGGNEPRQIMK
jgi:flagellar protein FlbD